MALSKLAIAGRANEPGIRSENIIDLDVQVRDMRGTLYAYFELTCVKLPRFAPGQGAVCAPGATAAAIGAERVGTAGETARHVVPVGNVGDFVIHPPLFPRGKVPPFRVLGKRMALAQVERLAPVTGRYLLVTLYDQVLCRVDCRNTPFKVEAGIPLVIGRHIQAKPDSRCTVLHLGIALGVHHMCSEVTLHIQGDLVGLVDGYGICAGCERQSGSRQQCSADGFLHACVSCLQVA